MAIDRIGTFTSTQILLSQMQKAETALDKSNQQVSSGKAASTYSGYGDQTAVMEGARSASAHADADYAAAQRAASRLDLQDTQMSQLSDLVGEVRQALTKAAADQDGTALHEQMEGFFEQAVGLLNSNDGNGYIYGGDNSQTPPVTVATLSDLAALPSVANAFANGTVKPSVRVGNNQTVQVGMLASDLGTQLFSLFQQFAQFDAGRERTVQLRHNLSGPAKLSGVEHLHGQHRGKRCQFAGGGQWNPIPIGTRFDGAAAVQPPPCTGFRIEH
jgi:flagellar hook-associated protein 3 FlgL